MQNPDSINLHWQFRSKNTHSRLSEVLLSAYRLLSRHPDVTLLELQKRLLQRASPYQVSPEGSFAVQLELGRFMYLQCNALVDAYDLLVSLSKTPESKIGQLLETERLALLAQIRIDQLQESLGRVHGRNGYNLLRSYSPQLWSAGGRTVRQLYDEAQRFINAAINLQPHRIETRIVSMALLWSKGQKEAAREVADKIPYAIKDKDAIAIKLALAVEGFGVDAVKDNSEQLFKLLKHSSDLLRIDPQCHASLKGNSSLMIMISY